EIIKQDFFTWENMKYLPKPNFAIEEAKDYAALRRWARRFYPPDEPPGEPLGEPRAERADEPRAEPRAERADAP
ncbi:MAG TPA: hypothetical protein VLL25_19160, partial [Acidimicrobiales bacterium]|nr:hypothetical protein [Acidimicrobiales bacterium]